MFENTFSVFITSSRYLCRLGSVRVKELAELRSYEGSDNNDLGPRENVDLRLQNVYKSVFFNQSAALWCLHSMSPCFRYTHKFPIESWFASICIPRICVTLLLTKIIWKYHIQFTSEFISDASSGWTIMFTNSHKRCDYYAISASDEIVHAIVEWKKKFNSLTIILLRLNFFGSDLILSALFCPIFCSLKITLERCINTGHENRLDKVAWFWTKFILQECTWKHHCIAAINTFYPFSVIIQLPL